MNRKLSFLITVFLFGTAFGDANSLRPMAENTRYGTHMAALVTAVVNTEGPVLEMGCGDFSTTILHAICSISNRFLLTAETNKDWMELFTDLERDWHKFKYVSSVKDWDNVGLEKHWSVVFIDHAPAERRAVDIKRLRNRTDIFVMHDTQEPSYRYDPVIATFKYKFVYKRYNVTTTLVSDRIDVHQFFEK